MVIGDRFAWAHLPKTAGSATVMMLGAFEGLVRSVDSPYAADAHVTFHERREQVEGKLLALNIRRLPAWVVSRAYYVSLHGVWPDFEPIPLPSAGELADSSFPDQRLALFTDDGRLGIDRWLRAESLAEDVIAFVSELREVTGEERARVRAVGLVNALEYDHDVSSWFTRAQVERLYERNPVWARVEERAYGEENGRAAAVA
jgi:hypothetical protein